MIRCPLTVIRRPSFVLRHAGAAVLVSVSVYAFAQGEDELKRYAELDRKCEAAREKKLAPLRAQKIDACVKQDGRPREQCERDFAHYGNTRGIGHGRAIGGLFYDLPECVAAAEARRRYRQ